MSMTSERPIINVSDVSLKTFYCFLSFFKNRLNNFQNFFFIREREQILEAFQRTLGITPSHLSVKKSLKIWTLGRLSDKLNQKILT